METPTFQETVAAVRAVVAAVDAGADHFAVLQVPVDATPVQIRDAYFRLTRLTHPDAPQIAHDSELRRLASRAFQLVSAANATLTNPERRQAYVDSLARSFSTARHSSGAIQIPADIVVRARPSSTAHLAVATPTHRPTPLASPITASRPVLAPEPLMHRPATPAAQARVHMQALAAPPDAKSASAYVDAARIQLGRRDWAAAQETLQLALPVLTEPTAIAECKVLLGHAIFSNLTNAEPFRLEHAKRLWNEVATHHTHTPQHGQAAYHLAMWHKLHGERHLVLHNLQVCLDLLPHHIEATREMRLLNQRRNTMAELAEMEARMGTAGQRRAPSGVRPPVKAQPEKATWLTKLFGTGEGKR